MSDRCLYFGCWNRAGHFLHEPNGRWPKDGNRIEVYGDRVHLDGTLAPRHMKRDGSLCWQGMGETSEKRLRIGYDSEEYPQGQFLRHELPNGFTAIQWWDRKQGDERGACNSTVLLEGKHTSEEMLAALREHFPHVLANLTRAGISLVEVVRA